ncbi:MAG: tetratricopeptide repeat protein [Bacteroidota bacterium]
MKFENFDNSTSTLSHLVAQYESDLQNGESAFLEEDAFLELVDYYDEEGQFGKALETLTHAIACHPFCTHLYLRKALLLIDAGKAKTALRTLIKAEALAPLSEDVLLLRSKAYTALGRYENALSLLNNCESTVNVLLQRAQIYEQAEDHNAMFDALQAALKLDCTHPAALEKMWLCTELSKKYEESLVLYDQLLVRDAYSTRTWYNVGQIQAYLGRYEEAIESFEYAYLIDEEFEFAYRDRAEMCYELRYYKEALASYEEIFGLFEPDADLYLRAGQCHYHLGDIRAARNHLLQAALLDMMQAEDIYYYLGLCYAAEGSPEKAIEFYEKAIDIEPHREEYYLSLAQTYESLEQWDLAEENYRLATDTAPENRNYWFCLTQFLVKRGQTAAALDAIEEAKDFILSTDCNVCHVALLMMTHQQEAAFDLFHRTLEAAPESARFLFELQPDWASHEVLSAIVAYHNA